MIRPGASHSTRLALGDVDPVQPLDVTNPLLRGVEGFWLPLPRLTGGTRLYDLLGHGRHGELTNMGPASDWVFDERAPFPALDFDGNNDRVDVSLSGLSYPITLIVFHRAPSTKQTGMLVSVADNSSDSNQDRVEYGPGGLRASSFDGNSVVSTPYIGGFDGEWHVAAAVFADSGLRAWINGQSATSSGGAATTPNNYNLLSFGVSADSTPINYYTEQIAGGALINRSVSNAELSYWQSEVGRGLPSLLNRRRSLIPLSGGGGGSTFSNSVSDTFTLSDVSSAAASINASATDAVGFSDTAGVTVTVSASVSDTINVSDAVAATLDANPALADTLTLTDDATGGNIFSEAVSDTLNLSDSVSNALTLTEAVADTLNVSDGRAVTVSFDGAVADTITYADALSAALSIGASLNDAVTFADDISYSGTFSTIDLPNGRTLAVDPENRTITVAHEKRIVTVTTD